MSHAPPTRSQRLKAASHDTHERLDARIMRSQPFASVEHFRRFVQVQLRFHHDVAPLYQRTDLAALLPDLAERQRLDQIRQDLIDLQAPAHDESGFGAPALPMEADLATALGWCYVVEGSNLGGAMLFKLAAKLGLNEHHGARHLAGHPDGRLRHWRGFTGMLDALSLDEAAEQALVAGARAAFERVHAHVARELG
jgi:heme oxygenase